MSGILGQLNDVARRKGLEIGLTVDDRPLAGRIHREVTGLRLTHRDKSKGPVVEAQACALDTVESAAADLLLAIR